VTTWRVCAVALAAAAVIIGLAVLVRI